MIFLMVNAGKNATTAHQHMLIQNNKKNDYLTCWKLLNIYFQGAFQPQATKIYDIITQYLHKQHLKIISPIKITTLKDFWTAKTRDDYISMLSVAVEKE